MVRSPIIKFTGLRALIIHPKSQNASVLLAQLERLGVIAERVWPAENVQTDDYDIIFFDADRGYDQQFSWKSGEATIPLVALMGSETPGRIQWALSHVPSAYIVKPIRPNGIYSAMAIAFHEFELRSALVQKIEDLGDRLRARPAVVDAILMVQRGLQVDSRQAYNLLRSEAMCHQISVESLCIQIAEAGSLSALKNRAETSGKSKSSGRR